MKIAQMSQGRAIIRKSSGKQYEAQNLFKERCVECIEYKSRKIPKIKKKKAKKQ